VPADTGLYRRHILLLCSAAPMDHIHLSRELFYAVRRGDLSQSVLDEMTIEHLLALCPHCRAEVEAMSLEHRSGPTGWSRILEVLLTLASRLSRREDLEARAARRHFQELLALPTHERAGRIERARGRFASPALVRLLLQESLRSFRTQPKDAFHFADLARKVANRNPRMPEYFDLYALATAFMANSCRAAGGLREADQYFTLVRQVIAEHGVTDLEIVARVDDLQGSLRKDQRRLEEAERLLKRAALLFSLRRASDDSARALFKLADVSWLRGDPAGAVETLRSALGRLGPASDPVLYVTGSYNLAFYLKEEGQYEHAFELLEKSAHLFQQVQEPWLQLRLLWLQADIAAGRGDLTAAERDYLATREGFISQGIGYDAAMVSLDLAVLYLRQGRTAEVRRLAEEMLPLFEAQDVHREALAALSLFLEASRQDQLTVETALEAAASLRKARGNEVP
jgi:tetratricopeptide (TPR) repeat protein